MLARCAIACLLAGTAPTPPTSEPAVPKATGWRVASAAGSPTWLDFGATHRTRYEHLWNQVRAGAPGNDMGLSLRTTASITLRPRPLLVGVELADSRLYLADDDSPLNTTLANPIDILQAYVGASLDDLGVRGSKARLRLGRITMDVGSRRLVARNRFRNTINAFTGVELVWSSPAEHELSGFATMPVTRLPSEAADIAANRIVLDKEALGSMFWGLHYASPPLGSAVSFEGYVLGLHEWDLPELATRNRRIVTPGLRVLRAPDEGRIDTEIEAVIQAGRSRATSAAEDTSDLVHLAMFGHGSVGYTFDTSWRPRLQAGYDYASGDARPDDGLHGRFDTLFGARRFELGPTGIYGALARSNLSSPGARFELAPHATVDGLVGYRAAWLAQARDAWTTSGLRDPTGQSGTFLGHQLEARVRWRPLPGNATYDLGFAHLVSGRFAVRAPSSNGGAGATYLYGQVSFEI